jgi:hypothetical protein
MLASCATLVRSRQIAAAPTALAIAGTAMQKPIRKWLRTIASRPVKVTVPPASVGLPPMPRMKSAIVFSIEESSPVAALALTAPMSLTAIALLASAAPEPCSRSRRVMGIVSSLVEVYRLRSQPRNRQPHRAGASW